MDIATTNNILGKYFFLNYLSPDYLLYFDELAGIFGDQTLDAPNVDTYDRVAKSVVGIAYSEQTYKDQPFTFDIEYQKVFNRIKAIVSDQNPDNYELNSSGSKAIAFGGEIGLTKSLDIIELQKNLTYSDFVKSILWLDCSKNNVKSTIPNTGSSSFSHTGSAKRRFEINRPVYFEGWNSNCSTSEQSTPDDTALVSEGAVWLRRDSGGSSTFNPRKAYFVGGSTGSFSAVSSNSRIDAVVIYETSKDGRNDTSLLIVQGTEAASPVIPTDSAVESAVDSASSGARWCRIANVTVDETASVVINTADIAQATLSTFTFNATPITIGTKTLADSWFLGAWDNYLFFLKQAGAHKRNEANISGVTSTALTYSTATGDIIEVGYPTAQITVWNPLVA